MSVAWETPERLIALEKLSEAWRSIFSSALRLGVASANGGVPGSFSVTPSSSFAMRSANRNIPRGSCIEKHISMMQEFMLSQGRMWQQSARCGCLNVDFLLRDQEDCNMVSRISVFLSNIWKSVWSWMIFADSALSWTSLYICLNPWKHRRRSQHESSRTRHESCWLDFLVGSNDF